MAWVSCLQLAVLCGLLFAPSPTWAGSYTAVDAARTTQPPIVLHWDAASGRGFDWAALSQPRLSAASPEFRLRDAVHYLQEGIQRLSGTQLEVASRPQIDEGIVLILRGNAPEAITHDAAITAALANDGSDDYNHREAFFLRSESRRLLLVANTVDGLVAAVPALLETVGYEVLGMGPNWTYVPQIEGPLKFDVELSDRPSYYQRQLTPTSGQNRGVGTISGRLKLTDPRDELVDVSYARWAVGIRNHGASMPSHPGHALYVYHRPVMEEMLRTGTTEGFLTPGNHLGLDNQRPAAATDNAGHLWINTDPTGQPGHQKVFVSDGKSWLPQPLVGFAVNVNVSHPMVRRLVLEEMQRRAEKHFAERPDEVFIFGTEAEDGAGYQRLGELLEPKLRNWYPEYLQSQGVPWPQPYALHGQFGLDQPQERWDYGFPADVVFAFNNWMLREYDRSIDQLPPAEQVTSTGKSKKSQVRCSLLSYAFHDVPPHFNLDPRIRVKIAGYPKHRGLGPWKQLAKAHDVAAAFHRLLPREPGSEYRIISISYYADESLEGLPARWSASPESVVADLHETYESGVRGLTYETDFNFGKYGLAYYLMSKVLWNSRLSAAELHQVRDRWLARAYGSGAPAMRRYHDYMLTENFPANGPGSWARALQWIDQADALIDPSREPAAQRRLDDLKQYWYWYYLLDTDQAKPDSPALQEFVWKGQMSYMTAMHMVVKRTFPNGSNLANLGLPAELLSGPAHYSAEETDRWWQNMHQQWPLVEVMQFADAVLADGRRGRDIDLFDLVRVTDFAQLTTGKPLIYNSAGQREEYAFVTTAHQGEPIGFQFFWPDNPQSPRLYGPKDVPYGIDYWDAAARRWQPVADITTAVAASQLITATHDGKPRNVARVQQLAPQNGTYRIQVGSGGLAAMLTSLGYDLGRGDFARRPPHAYFTRLSGLTQDPVFFYIPRGTRSLDLEVWDRAGKKQLQLYRGLSEKGPVASRLIEIGRRGTHRIPLESGEDGQLARIGGNGFAFPLLYSVPQFWAKSPAELLVPRAIAQADGWKFEE